MTKQSIMFLVSEEFADAIEAACKERGEDSRGELIRQAVASNIGYDISAEPKTARRTKYASAEERQKAALARAKDKRDMERDVQRAMEAGEQTRAIEVMQAWLDARKGEQK